MRSLPSSSILRCRLLLVGNFLSPARAGAAVVRGTNGLIKDEKAGSVRDYLGDQARWLGWRRWW